MGNATIIARMSDLVFRFEAGDLTATQLEAKFEQYLSALEGIRSRTVHDARQLTYELVCANAEEGEPDAQIAVPTVLQKLRSFLGTLPT
jgi:hypothetical protein